MSYNEGYYDSIIQGVGRGDRKQPFILPTSDGAGWSTLAPRWGEDDQGDGEVL